jgi:hypothetical protein
MYTEELREIYLRRIEELRKRLNDPESLSELDKVTVDGVFTATLSVVTALYGSDAAQTKALMEMGELSSTKGDSPDLLISSFGQSLLRVLMNIREEIEEGLVASVFQRRLKKYLEIWWVFAKVR